MAFRQFWDVLLLFSDFEYKIVLMEALFCQVNEPVGCTPAVGIGIFFQHHCPRGGGGGSVKIRLYRGVRSHYWKIDPFAD